MSPRLFAAAVACLLSAGAGTQAGIAPQAVPVTAAVAAPVAPWGASPFAAAAVAAPAGPGVNAFPFAPGGDDLLSFDDALPAAVALAPVAGPAAPREVARETRPPSPPPRALPQPLVVRAAFAGADRDLRFVLDARGRVAFLERDERDRWHDLSDELLDDDQRTACAAAVGAVAADFNGDGRPDVFVACDGPQVLFLSRADGRYERAETAFVLHPGAVDTADADGDGRADVLLHDAGRTLVLHGQGDGGFALGGTGPSASGTR